MPEEMKVLQSHHTWDLVRVPPDAVTVGCHWVFSIKYPTDGTLDRLKAFLVAKRYTSTYGVDFFETFSPIA